MNSHDLKQQVIRDANDAHAHARMVFAKSAAGLVVLALLAIVGAVMGPGEDIARPAAASAGRVHSEGNAEQLRRETFDARRARYEAGRRAEEPQKAATR